MKTTLEIPDALFRRAKTAAAGRKIPLRALVAEALTEKLASQQAKPWMESFGKLRHLRKETEKVNRVIKAEFGRVDPEIWK